jgi:hypothetical protein
MSAQNAAEIFSQLPCLQRPRPNGSRALAEAVGDVEGWLEAGGIPVQSHKFILRPYFMELLGLWLALTGLLMPLAAVGGWGWASLVLALAALAVPLLEVRFLQPTVTALVRQAARNLAATFPAPKPQREVILCAHVDSKTELLDHHQRGILLRLGGPAMGLALAAGLLTTLEMFLPSGTVRHVVQWLAVLAALPVAVYGLGMGANLAGGRFRRPASTGAVDNGAAVAVLLALALRLRQGDLHLTHTPVTLLFTVGEEAQMQGAMAYVRDRADWPVSIRAVNLEVVGQSGGYLLWEEDGTAMLRLPVDVTLNLGLARAVKTVAGQSPARVPLINSDAFAFLRVGIPAATLSSRDEEWGERGYHSGLDNPSRIDAKRLAETEAVLSHLLTEMDSEGASAQHDV